MTSSEPLLIHVTTTDISLELLLGPQLRVFAAAGYRVAGASAPGPYVEKLEADGIEHIALRHATRSMAPHRDARALAELRSIFRHRAPTIVHTHNPKPGIYGRLAAKAARVPVIVNTVHGLYAQPSDRFAKRSVVYSLERLAALASDAELVQNPEDMPVLRRLGIPAHKLTLLGNGIDLARFQPADAPAIRTASRAELGLAEGEIAVGVVGRLVKEKGYDEVFAAGRELAVSHPAVRFVIVGPHDPDKADGVTTQELDSFVADTGALVLGLRHDVERIYPALDLYVLASHREGFPRSAMEAAAAGLAIVATDIRGCRQVVDDGTTGLLVAPRATDELAAAIAQLVDDAALRRTMGDAAAAKATTDFDQRRVIDITLDTYSRLLAAR